MVRNVVATLLGVLLAFLVVMGFEWLGHRIWPWPSNLDWQNSSAVAAQIAARPLTSLYWLLLGWLVALSVGVMSCARIHATQARWPQWCTATVFALAVVSNFLVLPHPTWFVAVSCLSLAAGAWAAIAFASKLTPR